MKYRSVFILPPRSRLKVECRIYEDRKSMLKDARIFTRGLYSNLGKDTVAYCEPTLKLIPAGYLCVIFLNRADWSYGTIAHEMDHAANALMWRRGMRQIPCNLDMATPEEEQHADIMGELLDAFLAKYGL